MKYFGTDGIRGVVDQDLNSTIIKKLAKAIVKYYQANDIPPVILIANDSRASGDYILSILATFWLKYGLSIDYLGTSSSPCLAFITKKYKYSFGLMISASHNPHEYNGLKFFNIMGEKISTDTESILENYMDSSPRLKKSNFAKLTYVSELKSAYTEHLKIIKKNNVNCIIDCANGGASQIAKQIFSKNHIINALPDGYNINKNAGCTAIDKLRSMCIKKACIGFAIDGDGDRLHIVNKNGDIITGDKILFILSKFFLGAGACLVGTIYSNMGLESSLKTYGIRLIRAQVGDKCVIQKMHEYSSLIGGENSGHLIAKRFTNTGDGLLIAILISNILTKVKDIDSLLTDYKEYYQAHLNLSLSREVDVFHPDLRLLIGEIENLGCRVIIRKSGTEPLLRVMTEHEDEKTAKRCLKMIEELIKSL